MAAAVSENHPHAEQLHAWRDVLLGEEASRGLPEGEMENVDEAPEPPEAEVPNTANADEKAQEDEAMHVSDPVSNSACALTPR